MFATEDTIEFPAFVPLEALACVRPMAFPLGCSLLLPVGTVNCVQTLRASMSEACDAALTMNYVTALMTSHNTEGLIREVGTIHAMAI
jgi:hypothetical protein